MHASSFLAAGALLSLAAAVPMQLDARDIFWVTETQDVVVNVAMTTTVWVSAGQVEPEATGTKHGHGGHHTHHHRSTFTSHPTSTVTVHSVGSQPTSPPAVSTPQAPPTTAVVTQEPTSPTAPAPPPSPTSTTTSSSGGSGGSPTSPNGAVTTGEITYYAPGLGSCGITSSGSELVVAIPVGVMNNGANPNTNPLCGTTITLRRGSTSVTATIVDTCPTCADDHVDTAPAVFQQFGDLAEGVIQGVEWWFN